MKYITVKEASEITGLSIITIDVHAKRRNEPMVGKGMYKVGPAFLAYLKKLKPRKRKKHERI